MSGKPTMVKFATQLEANLLAQLRTRAHHEGRKVQSLVNEAVHAYLNHSAPPVIRSEVLLAAQTGQSAFGTVYSQLMSVELLHAFTKASSVAN